MKIAITGEKGFIAQGLIKEIKKRGHEFVSLCTEEAAKHLIWRVKGEPHQPSMFMEPCVHKNTIVEWRKALTHFEVDLVIHNAAVVGTDVVALSAAEATLTNVNGTYNIVRACEAEGILVSYMGTTVIYDTPNYQHTLITEKSTVKPTTYYGQLKQTGDMIVRESKGKTNIIRPLFAYGGEGDMNSLIAKSIYGAMIGREEIDMFLDPTKYKDYLHVKDYCTAVLMAAEQNLWGQDFIVAAEDPRVTGEIIDTVDQVLAASMRSHTVSFKDWPPFIKIIDQLKVPSEIVRWNPKTDYLGNHRLSSKSFRKTSGWSPTVNLESGIEDVVETILSKICGGSHYNPLKYLEAADELNIDLTKFY